jgi:hypothetical protein
MQKKMLCTICTLAFILCFALSSHAEMGSENYRIPTSVLSGGGAPMTSGSYQTNSTLGQPSPLIDPADPPYSTNYDLYPGFWYTVELGPVVEPCEGDFDDDGDVDGSDLAVFAADFGRTDCANPPPCEGDFDHDGDVDGSDLAVFAADFGRTDCPH